MSTIIKVRDYYQVTLPAKIRKKFHLQVGDYVEVEETDKKLKVLLRNPKHTSLRVKKIKSAPGIFKAGITKNYRFTFQIEGNNYILRRVGLTMF